MAGIMSPKNLRSTVFKLYPDISYGFVMRLNSEHLITFDEENNTTLMVKNEFIEIEKEFGSKFVSRKQIFAIYSKLIGHMEKQNLTLSVDIKSNSETVLSIKSGYNCEKTSTSNADIHKFYLVGYPDMKNQLKNYSIITDFKITSYKISDGSFYFNWLDSAAHFQSALFHPDYFKSSLHLSSPNIDKKYQFGFIKQSNYVDETQISPVDKLTIYLNDNTISVLYGYNDINYTGKIGFKIHDFINLVGDIEFEGGSTPYFQHSIVYDINGKKCNVFLKSVTEENVIVNLLQIESDILIKFSFNIDMNYIIPSVEMIYLYSGGENTKDLTYSLRVTYDNDDSLINKLVCNFKSPFVNEKSISIIYSKHFMYDNVFFDVSIDSSSVLTLQKDDLSGSLYVSLNEEEHFMKYNMKFTQDNIFKVNAEAKFFTWIINMGFNKYEKDFKINLKYYKQTFDFESNNFVISVSNGDLYISGDLYMPIHKLLLGSNVPYPDDVYTFVITFKNSQDDISGRLTWKKNYNDNTFLFVHRKNFPYNTELKFTYLNKVLQSLFVLNETHISCFTGNADKTLKQFVSLQGAMVITGQRFQSFFDLQSPFILNMTSFNFNMEFDDSYDSTEKVVFNLFYTTHYHQEFNGIKSRLFVTDGSDAAIDISFRTPFKNYEKFYLSIYLQLLADFLRGKISTQLPNDKNYDMYFDIFKNESDTTKSIDLSTMFYCYDINKNSSESILNKEDRLEYSLLASYKQITMDNGRTFINDVIWNEEKVVHMVTSYSFNLEKNSANLLSKLTTVIPGHENYELSFNFENNLRKNVKLELHLPYLKGDTFIVNVLYSFPNLTYSDIKFNLNVPFYPDLKNIKFYLGNDVSSVNYNVFSSLNISWAKKLSFGYKTSLKFTRNMTNVDLLFESNDKNLGFKWINEKNDEVDNILINIVTPFQVFKQAKIDGSFSKNIFNGSKFVTEYNNIELFAINFTRDDFEIKSVKIKLLERIIFIEHYYNLNLGYRLFGKIGWKNSVKDFVSYVKNDISIAKAKSNYFILESVLPNIQRNSRLEISLHKDNNEDIYFGKLSLNKETNFGFKLTSKKQTEKSLFKNEVQLILPSKLVILNYEKQNSDKIFNKYISLSWGNFENETKKIGGGYNVEKFDDGLTKRKLLINHFTLVNDLEFTLTTNRDRIIFDVSCSPEKDDKFTAEVKRWISNDNINDISNNSLMIYGTEMSVSNRKLNFLYKILANYSSSSDVSNLGFTYEYINMDNIYQYASIFGKIDYKNHDIRLITDTNRNKVLFGGSVWSKSNNYYGFTAETAINNKEPLKLEIGLNSNNPELEMELDYGVGNSYHLYTGLPDEHLLKAEISHTLYGSQTDDFIAKIQLNTSRLLWGSVKYSPEIYVNFMSLVVHEYENYGDVVNEISNSLYDIVMDENIFVKPYGVYNNTVNVIMFMVDETFIEIENVLIYSNDVSTLFVTMYDGNQYYIKDVYNFFKSGVLYTGDKVMFCLKKFTDIFQSLTDFFSRLTSDILKEFCNAKVTIGEIQTTVKGVLRVFLNGGKETFVKIKSLKSDIIVNFKFVIEEMRKNLNSFEKELFLKYHALEVHLFDLYTSSMYYYNVQSGKINNLIGRLFRFIITIEESIFEILLSIRESLLAINELKSLINFCSEYSYWLKEMKLNNYLNEFKIFMEEALNLIAVDVHDNFGEYKTYLNTVSDVVVGNYDTVINNPIGSYLHEICNRIYYKTKWLWHYSEMSDRLKNSLRQLFVDVDKVLQRFIKNIDNVSNSDEELKSSFLVSPDRTYVEFSQELPVDWHSFNTLPNIHQLSVDEDTVADANNTSTLDKYKYYLYDAVSYYTGSDLSVKNIVPEFSSTAMIAGNHYVTFDGLMYDFDDGDHPSGSNFTSYILAGDLINNKFTIVINYLNNGSDKHMKNSLTVLTEGHQININFKSKLTINGKRMELPKFIGNSLTIYRDVNNIIMKSKHGFDINCNTKYDLCIFKLSGWYFGKTGGLLGTYNNEPVDDYSYANGTITQSIQQFTNSWIVHSNDQYFDKFINENKYIELKESSEDEKILQILKINDNDVCKNYFENRSSIFASCFHVVNPDPYLHICNEDMSKTTYDTDVFIALCTNAALYVAQCHDVGVKLVMPAVCDRCDSGASASSVQLGNAFYFDMNSPPPSSSDVIFVLEQSSCINKIKLSDVIGKLDVALSRNGINNNRYAVITYGRTDPASRYKDNLPYINTIDGDIWTEKVKNIEKAFKRSLYLSSNDILSSNLGHDNSINDEYPPAYRALMYASSLKFRPGVSKTMILIQCDKCSKTFVATSYMDMIRTMLDADITLHVLQHGAIRRLSRKSSKIFGVDINGAFTVHNVKSLTPDLALLKKITLPKDLCSPVALETNGTLFNLDTISGKKFIDVWVRRIALTAMPSGCQECSCLQMDDGSSNTICRKCVNPLAQEVVSEWDTITMDASADEEEKEEDYVAQMDSYDDYEILPNNELDK